MDPKNELKTDDLRWDNMEVSVEDTDTVDSIEQKILESAQQKGITVTNDGSARRIAQETYEHFFDSHGNLRPESIES